MSKKILSLAAIIIGASFFVGVQFSLAEVPSVTILSPNGGETYKNDGGPITVNWQTNNILSSQKLDLIRLRANSNSQEYYLAYGVLNDGQEVLSIPVSVPVGAYTLEIKTYVDNILAMDSSDSYFKLVDVSQNQPSAAVPVCSMPVCEAGSNPYDTGKIESNGCKNYACPSKTCSAPVCKDGTKQYDTGKIDDNNCKVYDCVGQTSVVISEKVKCWFKGSQTEQQCYAAVDDKSLTCLGKESCIIDVTRTKGEKITWKSSCGGYAYTTMDGTGGYDGRGEYAEFDCAPVSATPSTPTATTPKPTENRVEIIEMKYIAKDMADNKYDSILSELKQLRDTIKEQQSEIKYLKSLTNELKNVSETMKSAINDFITYGVDANTVKLGAGERAAVINSYEVAFDKLPETEAELTDAIKIANGRFPSLTSDKAEKLAKEQFIKIYKRIADLNDAKDNAAIKVMAYGLRQKAENRNLNSEKEGIKIFKNIFGAVPQTTEDWNTMQAITYSGATR